MILPAFGKLPRWNENTRDEGSLAVECSFRENQVKMRLESHVLTKRMKDNNDANSRLGHLQQLREVIIEGVNRTVHIHLPQGPVFFEIRPERRRDADDKVTMGNLEHHLTQTLGPLGSVSLPTAGTDPTVAAQAHEEILITGRTVVYIASTFMSITVQSLLYLLVLNVTDIMASRIGIPSRSQNPLHRNRRIYSRGAHHLP